MTAKRVKYACAYYVDQAYGGPEEGGWYYDCGEHILTLPFLTIEEPWKDGRVVFDEPARAAAKATLTEMCEALGQDTGHKTFKIFIEESPGHDYPTERPYYE